MPAEQLKKQLFVSSPIELEEPYSLDKWPIKEWPIYKNATDKDKHYFNSFGYEDASLNFSYIESALIKDEIKWFFYYLININNYKLRTVTEHFSRSRHVASYANEHPELNSVLNIDEADYIKYLLKAKIIQSRYVGTPTHVNGEMELVREYRRNRAITLLGYIKTVVDNYYNRHIPEQEKDYWDLKNFPFLDHSHVWRRLDFRGIPQPQIKEVAKKYYYYKLKSCALNNLYTKVHEVTVFAKWLNKEHSEIDNLSKLNRKILEEYFEYLRLYSGLKTHGVSNHILSLKKFLEEGSIFFSKDFPTVNLILNTDYRIKPVRNAEFYSDNEIKNINKVLPELPVLYSSAVFCLETLALRASDLLSLKPSMIVDCNDGGLYKHEITLEKKIAKQQIKTSEPLQLYLTEPVYKILMNMLEESKKKYGDDVEYIFASSKTTHISYSTLARTVNRCFYENKVMADNGKILRFKTHKFRATKATKLIEKGFGATEAARALGHSSLQSLSYYATITEDTLIDSLSPYLAKTQIYIENIGKKAPSVTIETDKLLPLCNGWCCRPIAMGICKHANKCLTCSLFKPDSRHISYYKLQLQELEATLGAAKAVENETLIKKTEEDIIAVERIITEVERLCSKETQKD